MPVLLERSSKKLMVCVLCGGRFSDEDSWRLDYFPDTGVCFECYEKMRKKPYRESCFGKLSKVEGGVMQRGYDPWRAGNLSCTMLCPDKVYCPLFAWGEIYRLRQVARVL